MQEMLILGTSPVVNALDRVLKICTSCRVKATGGEPEWLAHDGDLTSKQRVSWRTEIKHCDVIVALPSLLRHPSEAISLVHRLRTDLYWNGFFIAVVMSDPQAAQLREASFVGEPVDSTCFGQVSGHVALAIPLHISELLCALNETDDTVSPDYWHLDLLRSGRAAQLNRQIKKATRVLNDPQVEGEGRRACRDILASLETIDWSIVARKRKGHALHNSVQSLLEEHTVTEHLTTEACSTIVKEARRILAQSTFPFPSEE